MSESSILSVDHLAIAFGKGSSQVVALRDVSLDVSPGQVVGIVGESGCGKSTLAYACLGYVAPGGRVTAGGVMYRGQDLFSLPQSQIQSLRGRQIAMVYQNPLTALNPCLRIGDQVAEVMVRHLGLARPDAMRRAADLFTSVGLPDPDLLIGRYPHQLSGGQQQRVVIAMALSCDPDVLVMDEPTTGLDVTTEATILDLVADLRTRINAAILFVTHNLGVVAQICDRVVVMYAGDIVEEAPLHNLFVQPRHPYSLGLLQAVPDVTKQNKDLVPIPGHLPQPGSWPSGCSFAPRCSMARDVCSSAKPPLAETGVEHHARCFFWNEVPAPEARSSAEKRPDWVTEDPDLLTIDGLRKYYVDSVSPLPWIPKRRTKAVDGVSLALGKAETFAIVGESGCGKSTLSSCVVGLQSPTEGSLTLDDERLAPTAGARPPEQRRRVQIVFQNPDASLNPARTVFEAVARPLQKLLGYRGGDRLRKEVAALLREVNLNESYLDRYPAQLSGGEKQRVGIARALAGEPSIIVCDEPVSALDVSVQATVLNLLERLQHERSYSYLFISHDLAVVRHLADRVGVMYLGGLVEVGPVIEVFTPPYHPYTEALLSAAPAPDPAVRRERIRLTGTVPSAANPPSGCPFHTRCPRKLGLICEQEPPPWQHLPGGLAIRCHIPAQDLRRQQLSTSPNHETGAGDEAGRDTA